MSTKREITEAQQRLNRAVDAYLEGPGSPGSYSRYLDLEEARDALRDATNGFDADAAAARRATSIAAGKANLPRKGSMRRNIVQTLVAQHLDLDAGMTCDELERRLRKSHQTASPAVNHLEMCGWIYATDERRKTTLGEQAIVWRPTPKALDHVRAATLEGS